jgi:hypothetical protein
LGEHVRNLGSLCFEGPAFNKIKKLVCKVHCPIENWTLSTPNTTWEKRPQSPPTRKKGRPLHSMTQLRIGCMEILFLKLAATILGLN